MNSNTTLDVLIGKTLVRIDGARGNEEITFETDTGERFRLIHYRDCCETVNVEDISGDLKDLLNTPITKAEVVTNTTDEPPKGADVSYTWTYYHLATILGYVTIRWFGTSNGYYSETVDFERVL